MPGFLYHRALGTCCLNHQPNFNFIAAAFCLMRKSWDTSVVSPFPSCSSVPNKVFFSLLFWGWHTCLHLQILAQILSTCFLRYSSFRTWSFCSQCVCVGSFQCRVLLIAVPMISFSKNFYRCTWVIYLVPSLTTITCWQLSCQCLNCSLKMWASGSQVFHRRLALFLCVNLVFTWT